MSYVLTQREFKEKLNIFTDPQEVLTVSADSDGITIYMMSAD